jgi:hypothetical protein
VNDTLNIRFVHEDGTPIPGVELRVENEQGTNFYHYPVTDYVEGRVPTSDTNGVLKFHHVAEGPEYGGRCWLLYGLCFGTCQGPTFVCRFLLEGQETPRAKCNDMNTAAKGPPITRTWNQADWLPAVRHGETIMVVFSREYDQRDKDRNGMVDMGEAAALDSIARQVDTANSVERGNLPAETDLKFWTYQHTAVVR